MRYLSIFSGIEAASVAAQPLGWEPIAFAEIDPFPSAVLAERFPEVPNLGDVTQIDWGEVVRRFGRPDVLVGGSPCQSFSVAGNRESLEGESRLMYEYIRAVGELRPRWFVWENVPGCLNTKDDAFTQLLEEMESRGYKDLAWRVLDAQFCRVPLRDDRGSIVGWYGPVAQRRRRVFLVGHVGEGFRSAAVLFEPESVRGDNPSSREKRKELAAALGRGPSAEGGCLTPWDAQSKRLFDKDSCWPTLYSAEKSGQQSVAVAFAQNNRMEVRLIGGEGDHVGALAAQPDFGKGQGGSLICMASGQANAEISGGGDPSPALMARQYKDPPFLVHQTGKTYYTGGVAPTLPSGTNEGMNIQPIIAEDSLDEYVIRRLTPRECERLQGFSDDWTLIPWKGKPAEECPDGPRYKAIGNSMATNVMRLIFERLQEVDSIQDDQGDPAARPQAGHRLGRTDE